ncbi:hypothetical protein LTV02_14765 [Nocardia yamanashiensis]|uniref:hypothetical protein n=1 Tax=Nocardia yamanashiensis TaxID=209247 RepID=UPI001E42F55A|nr:hypothetical protein [Nocardia yamanashiensis]UGT44567.1 hypothetical protein LTV02_14765 [Nocardia yamanashiensis]
MRIRGMVAGALLAAGLLTGAAACSNSTESGSPGTTTGENRGPVFTSEGAPSISTEAAQQLCEMMKPEVSKWRDQGPTIGRVAFNGTVHNWAMRNNGINAAVMRDRAVVDQVTTSQCPDVRQDAIAALEIDSLAAGLAGF